MPKNDLIKVKDLKYKKSSGFGFFDAFQLTLTNGISSQVFNAPKENNQDMKSFKIKDYSLVKKIAGTPQISTLKELHFCEQDGN